MNMQTTLKNQERDLVLKTLYKWLTENSRHVTKAPFITASPFLLETYRFFPNVYFDKYVGLITFNLKNNEKLTQYTVDMVCSQDPRLCLQLILFHSSFW